MKIDYVALGNIVIDDIVLYDGTTMMGMLGGASPHALVGARVWADGLGIVAMVGDDFADAQRVQLERLGIDLRGVVPRPQTPTARSWQLIEADSRRTEVFRTSLPNFLRDSAQFEHIPADYLQAKGIHLYWAPSPEEAPDLLRRLRAVNPSMCLVWEPGFQWHRSRPGELTAAMPLADLVSPDDTMALAMTGQATVEAALATYLDWGARLVAIRMAAAGSLVGDAAGQRWRIPAVPTQVVDATGAGNAYCGGFMVGLAEGLSPLEAALRATVSASFALEQFGLAPLIERPTAAAQARLAWARERVR